VHATAGVLYHAPKSKELASCLASSRLLSNFCNSLTVSAEDAESGAASVSL
jgi:hypothetical protein